MTKFEKKIASWTDEEALEKFLLMLDRVEVATAFILDSDKVIRKQVMVLSAGDKSFTSHPMELEMPLVFANAKDVGESVN